MKRQEIIRQIDEIRKMDHKWSYRYDKYTDEQLWNILTKLKRKEEVDARRFNRNVRY